MKVEHILLTTDLSEESVRAFEPAAELARGTGARITLLHVVQLPTPTEQGGRLAAPFVEIDPREREAATFRRLETQRARLGSAIEAVITVIEAPAIAEAIADFAVGADADLIAMSTHGRGGVRRLLLGSVAEGVLRHATVPVLLFPPAK